MRKRKVNFMETLAFYLVERSVGKSIPAFLYKVEQPKDIEKIIEDTFDNNSSKHNIK